MLPVMSACATSGWAHDIWLERVRLHTESGGEIVKGIDTVEKKFRVHENGGEFTTFGRTFQDRWGHVLPVLSACAPIGWAHRAWLGSCRLYTESGENLRGIGTVEEKFRVNEGMVVDLMRCRPDGRIWAGRCGSCPFERGRGGISWLGAGVRLAM